MRAAPGLLISLFVIHLVPEVSIGGFLKQSLGDILISVQNVTGHSGLAEGAQQHCGQPLLGTPQEKGTRPPRAQTRGAGASAPTAQPLLAALVESYFPTPQAGVGGREGSQSTGPLNPVPFPRYQIQ